MPMIIKKAPPMPVDTAMIYLDSKPSFSVLISHLVPEYEYFSSYLHLKKYRFQHDAIVIIILLPFGQDI